jgi:hypothetical protein
VAAKNPYMFAGDAAMTLNFIKADKTGGLRDGDRQAEGSVAEKHEPHAENSRRWGWKIFKASEAGPNGQYFMCRSSIPW